MKTIAKFVRYEDDFLLYVWKPAGIPTSFWKEKSFLELLFETSSLPFLEQQKQFFSQEEEWGLLNRLDNATSWLLYFAKTPAIKAKYKALQQQGKLKKTYLAEVYGDFRYWIIQKGNIIDFPIAHHKFLPEKMIVLTDETKKQKADSRLHQVQTKILEYEWDTVKQTTILLVEIQKWIRHQIRSHLSAIGYPIVWDELYGKKKDPQKGNLQLVSVGLEFKD